MFLHIHPKRRDIAVSVRSSSYCVTSLVLLLLLPFCLSVCLSFYSSEILLFYLSQILLILNFTHPKFYSSEILLLRNGCWCTQLAAIAWHHSSDRAHNKRLSLARTTGLTLCVRKITQMLIIVEGQRLQILIRGRQRLQIMIIGGQILIHRGTMTSMTADIWHKPHHIQILPKSWTKIKWITFPRNFPRR